MERAGDDAYEGTDEAGYGSAYGTAVHRLFEWAVRSRGDGPQPAAERALVERLWAEHDVQTPVRVRARGPRRAYGRPSSGTACSRPTRYTPRYTWPADSPRPPQAGGGSMPTEPVIWRGTVDLAYRDDAGWHLVDYKTDGDAVGRGARGAAPRGTPSSSPSTPPSGRWPPGARPRRDRSGSRPRARRIPCERPAPGRLIAAVTGHSASGPRRLPP